MLNWVVNFTAQVMNTDNCILRPMHQLKVLKYKTWFYLIQALCFLLKSLKYHLNTMWVKEFCVWGQVSETIVLNLSILMKFIIHIMYFDHIYHSSLPPIFSSSTLLLLPQYSSLFFLKDYWVILVLPDIYGCKVIYWARLTFQDFIGEGTLLSLQQLYQLPPSSQ